MAPKNSNLDDLIRRVLSKDYSVQLVIGEVGSAANPELIKLAGHNDPEVRELALLCLDKIDGPGASDAFVVALLDQDEQVAHTAARALHNHPDSKVYRALLDTFDLRPGSGVLREIPLIIGRMDMWALYWKAFEGTYDLRERYRKEHDEEAREGLLVALARLGDEEAQTEFIKRLHSSSDQERIRYLNYCEYIQQGWLLKPLDKLLDNKSPMLRVALDVMTPAGCEVLPGFIEYLRTCDLAVILIASISGVRFSFQVNRLTNYSDVQIAEVKSISGPFPRVPQSPSAEGEESVCLNETFELIEGRPHVTKGGVEFVLKTVGHYHLIPDPDGTSAAHTQYTYTFEIAKGEKREAIKYGHDNTEQFYLEGVAFGEVYSISESDSRIEVKLYSFSPSEALTAEQALKMAKRTMREQGLPLGNGWSLGEGDGLLKVAFWNQELGVIKSASTAMVGLYTHKVIVSRL